MSGLSLQEDTIYYRAEYARIARLLERETEPQESFDDPERRELLPQEEAGRQPSSEISLSRKDLGTIEAILDELTPEQMVAGDDSLLLWMDAAALALRAGQQLKRLRWHWVGRRPVWYLRWWGWLHWRRQHLLLGEFLDSVLEPVSVTLYFSCLLQEDCVGDPREILRPAPRSLQPLRRPTLDDEASIDLDEAESWLRTYLSHLIYSAGALAARNGRPPQRHQRLLQHLYRLAHREERLLGWLGVTWMRPAAPLNYRPRYNLACLFSRAAARSERPEVFLDAAAGQLRLALEALHGSRRSALAEWARNDPALRTLRDADGGRRFYWVIPSS